jgi:hypothetical protein
MCAIIKSKKRIILLGFSKAEGEQIKALRRLCENRKTHKIPRSSFQRHTIPFSHKNKAVFGLSARSKKALAFFLILLEITFQKFCLTQAKKYGKNQA